MRRKQRCKNNEDYTLREKLRSWGIVSKREVEQRVISLCGTVKRLMYNRRLLYPHPYTGSRVPSLTEFQTMYWVQVNLLQLKSEFFYLHDRKGNLNLDSPILTPRRLRHRVGFSHWDVIIVILLLWWILTHSKLSTTVSSDTWVEINTWP